jgi:hypothetical protein
MNATRVGTEPWLQRPEIWQTAMQKSRLKMEGGCDKGRWACLACVKVNLPVLVRKLSTIL